MNLHIARVGALQYIKPIPKHTQ